MRKNFQQFITLILNFNLIIKMNFLLIISLEVRVEIFFCVFHFVPFFMNIFMLIVGGVCIYGFLQIACPLYIVGVHSKTVL